MKRYCTHSTPHHTYNNLLKDQLPVTQAHQVWSSDLTRLVYRGTVWYLATIEDVATRQVIAKQIGKRHDSQLVLATLKQALATRHTPHIFQSDQGNEFMPRRCTDYLEQRGVQISVRDLASPWQNGYIGSFYGRLKHELGHLDRFETPGEMIEAIYWHLHYCNHHRIHTALNMTPVAYALKIASNNGLHKLGT